jgi:hypothetical protein
MSYATRYATAGLGQTMYAAAGLGQTMYAAAGLGLSPGNILKNTRGVQETLILKGFSVGSTGADGVWGRNSRAAYDRALGSGSSSRVSVSGSNLELPEEHWGRIQGMPNRPVSSSSGGSTSSGTRPSPSAPTTIGPSLDPAADPAAAESGVDWMGLAPWIGGGALALGLGGFLIWKGRKARMKKNRRRRRSSRRSSRRAMRRNSRRRTSRRRSSRRRPRRSSRRKVSRNPKLAGNSARKPSWNKKIYYGKRDVGRPSASGRAWYVQAPNGSMRFMSEAAARKMAKSLAKSYGMKTKLTPVSKRMAARRR